MKATKRQKVFTDINECLTKEIKEPEEKLHPKIITFFEPSCRVTN